jgi:hypothetical protein
MHTLRLVLPLMALVGTAQAGVTLKMESKDSSGKSTPFETYYAQDGMLRVDSLDASGTVQRSEIVRDGVVWRVNPGKRTYTRIDEESIKAMFGEREQHMETMLARLPPDKRAAMEARMEKMKQGNTDFAFTDTGKSDTVGKYSCRVWQETRTGKLFMEFCVVPAASLPDGADLEASMKKSLQTVHQVLSGVPQLANAAEHFTRMEKMGGFPVRSRVLSPSGTTESEHVLSSAQAQALPADKFAIPQGYTEAVPGKEDN